MILKLVRILICSCLLYSSNGFAESSGQETLVIGMISDLVVHQQTMRSLKKAYKEAGLKVAFVPLPSRRSLHDANSGQLDGDAGRIAGAEELYPNLVPVPTPVYTIKGSAFVINELPDIQSWEDLEPYRVGIVRGILFAENGTAELHPLRANSYEHLFSLLVAGRIDIAVSEWNNAQRIIQKSFPEQGIHTQGDPLFTGDLYHYLHKKHQHLIPVLDAALRQTGSRLRQD